MKIHTIFLMNMALMLSACTPKYSEVPTATNFENSHQKVLQAAHHWDIVNKSISEQLLSSIAGKVSKDETILITYPNSLYARNLYRDVVIQLVNAGYTVLRPESKKNKYIFQPSTTSNDLLIELNPTIIKFSRGRKQPHDVGYPSAIATGLWALKGIGATAYSGATAGIYAYDVYDWFSSQKFSDGTPQTEIVIDLSVFRKNQYIAMTKDIYYIVDTDTSLYQAVEKDEPLVHQYQVLGAGK